MKELSLLNCRIDGRYDIQNLLGRGSYAEIYVARDNLASVHSPHRLVVIKALNVFLQDDLDADLEKTLVENFQNEAIALDRVRHPNIISRLGHGTARDLRGTVFHYLILEFLSGGDLAKLQQNKKLEVEKAFIYLEQICAGLAHAHKCGIIHRDIKPQNLLLTQDLKIVKIADFGVARFSQNDSPITRVGTNMYAPPEHSPVFSDPADRLEVKALTPAADVYSLAKSAYVLLTGESPRRFTNLPIEALPDSFANKSWGNDLLRVLRKATRNIPAERQQSVNEFWQEMAGVKTACEIESVKSETIIATKTASLPQAAVSQDFTPQAPVLPQFKTSEDFKIPMTDDKNPHFVVRLPNQSVVANQATKPILNHKNQIQFEIPPREEKVNNGFVKRVAFFLVLLAVFAGALFATQNYLRYGRIFPQTQTFTGKNDGFANSDVNIRADSGVDNDIIGLVPKDSKVKILDTRDNWYKIEIVEMSRPKKNPGDAEKGWVNKRYISTSQD